MVCNKTLLNEQYKNENTQFREFLEIKQYNTDFTFEPASVIGRPASDRFGSFTIDVGSFHGVTVNCPVITADGLVGIVSEVAYTHSNVKTILDPSVNVSGLIARSLDTGIVTGDSILADSGLCRINYLIKESSILKSDLVITSGIGGLFPKGLIIGEVSNVTTESSGISLYAEIKPSADIHGAKNVFVIKDFAEKSE